MWRWFFFFKQKTAYEMRISDWSSDVCSSDLVGDAVERGAQLLTGGRRGTSDGLGEGTFYEATVLTDVRAGSDILREEIFGPVLAIVPFDTEDEAVDRKSVV